MASPHIAISVDAPAGLLERKLLLLGQRVVDDAWQCDGQWKGTPLARQHGVID